MQIRKVQVLYYFVLWDRDDTLVDIVGMIKEKGEDWIMIGTGVPITKNPKMGLGRWESDSLWVDH